MFQTSNNSIYNGDESLTENLWLLVMTSQIFHLFQAGISWWWSADLCATASKMTWQWERGRATLKEELRVLFYASYYNLTVLKQVFLPCKYTKLSLNHSSAKKLIELIRIYRKLTTLIYNIKMTHALGRLNKTQVMHTHCTHVSFCTRKKCNSNWAKVGVR